MKKLSICRNCKRRFLIEPGRDNCPKCGGPLYKTDLEEQYWELYTEDQRAELISRLMVEMEQKAGAGTNGTAGQSGAGAYGSIRSRDRCGGSIDRTGSGGLCGRINRCGRTVSSIRNTGHTKLYKMRRNPLRKGSGFCFVCGPLRGSGVLT